MKINIFRSGNRFSPLFSLFSSSKTSKKLNEDAFKSVQNVDEAESLFRYMLQLKPRPHISQYHKLFTIIVHMKQYKPAVILFKKMLFMDFPVNEYFMSSVIHCYSQINRVDLGFPVIAAFLKRGFSPNIVSYNSLIRGCFLQGDVDEAVSLFKNSIRNKVEVDEFTVSILLNGLCKSGNIDAACELLDLAERKNWKLNVVSYSSLLDGLVKSRMFGEAMKLMVRMVDSDISPNIVSYNTLLDGLCKNNMLNVACSLFSDLSSKGVEPDVVTCNVMIHALTRGGQFQAAKDILQNMEKVGLVANTFTYNTILFACIRHCDDYHSADLLKQVVGKEFELAPSTLSVLLEKISKIRQMPGIYDDDIVMHLMQKLGSFDRMREVKVGDRGSDQ